MPTNNSLSRYHGAVLVKYSPDLLDWLTRYSPKSGDSRKLRFEKDNEERFFARQELLEFDKYLRAAWPCNEGDRPNIPAGIKREVKEEAEFMCAICGTAIRELAHIDPIHATSNNHPHNLICLCPNHHTEYDEGRIRREEIVAKKKGLIRARLTLWRLQAEGFDCAVRAIAEIGRISGLPASITQLLEAKSLEELAKAANRAPKSDFATEVSAAAKAPDAPMRLDSVRERELRRSHLADCPLCEGSGSHNNWECPVCSGTGTVHEDILLKIDLSPFEQEPCNLCEGSGSHNNWECPVCRGVGTIDKDYASEVDLSAFEQEQCPLCEGSGSHNNWECPVCRGVGTIDKDYASEVDLSAFEQEQCSLCEGSGSHNNWECPVCRGVGTIDKNHASEVDLSAFEQEQCPLCEGSGSHNNWECPVCKGGGTVDKGIAAEVDLSLFEQVECPSCEGSGSCEGLDCSGCRGIGTIDARLLE